jgi:hypothetical protein
MILTAGWIRSGRIIPVTGMEWSEAAESGTSLVPALAVIAGIVLLAVIVMALGRWNACERYTQKQFEAGWITDRAKGKGLCYRDRPGCYVILAYRFRPVLPFAMGYDSVYAGQSMTVYHRVHSHLNRKGNGDIYADRREGKWIEIEVYPCTPRQLNDLERKLIRRYHAENSYNRTAGGGMKRGFF